MRSPRFAWAPMLRSFSTPAATSTNHPLAFAWNEGELEPLREAGFVNVMGLISSTMLKRVITGGKCEQHITSEHHFGTNVRNKNVLRAFGKSGFPLNVAAPF